MQFIWWSDRTLAGEVVGYILEEDSTFVSMLKRQLLRTHRPFSALILDLQGTPVLSVSRPFYFINSQITITDVETQQVIGEVHQHWHLWRRRYDLFLKKQQFARADEGFLAIQFAARDEEGVAVARVDKNWTGFGREFLTDARQYAIRFDDALLQEEQPTDQPVLRYDERAVVTAMAVSNTYTHTYKRAQHTHTHGTNLLSIRQISIDFDYFSLHSGGPGILPLFFFLGE